VKLVFKPTNIPSASQFEFEADVAITVGDLKELISPQLGGLAPQSIRLVCAGRVWQDPSTLESYEISDGSIVHCLNNPQAPGSTAGIASTQALQPANPMMGMMGGMPVMGGAAGGGTSLQDMMAQSQQMMRQNPEMLQQMMQDPMVQQMFENPEFMRSMMQMNPQTRQLMESHPEIARMLEDPEMLRQGARMMANPSLMQEMMRNQDVAMGRLDAMPGGHAALARMHRDVVDPMHNAMTVGEESNTAVNQYSEDAQGHRNTAPLANPWGSSQPVTTAAQTATQPAAPAMTTAGAPAAGAPANSMQQLMQMQSWGGDPMAQWMQPMMQNMQMAQQANQTDQSTNAAMNQQSNPLANIMQAMQQNPQLMQQMMMMDNMMGGIPPPMFGAPAAQTGGALDETAIAAAASNPMVRARFAQQLDAMIAMGFSDEQMCLRALIEYDGNVDRALDKMFAQN